MASFSMKQGPDDTATHASCPTETNKIEIFNYMEEIIIEQLLLQVVLCH